MQLRELDNHIGNAESAGSDLEERIELVSTSELSLEQRAELWKS